MLNYETMCVSKHPAEWLFLLKITHSVQDGKIILCACATALHTPSASRTAAATVASHAGVCTVNTGGY